MSLPLWDPRKALESPVVYNFFQKAVRADKSRRRFFDEYLMPLAGERILEVGCGPGTNCEWLPEGIRYVGCDMSGEYIEYAKRRFGGRADFYASSVGQLRDLNLVPFRAIFALALLHHLNDEQVLTLCDEVLELLQPGGMFVTADPCFTSGQSRIERFITSCDRGKYVRTPLQYQALLQRKFSNVEVNLARADSLIPNTGVAMRGWKTAAVAAAAGVAG
jgi:2-polyprenyl-3-methyl-5-hydroxy-6-metoxy-1,4-benzoquinol methylase